MGNMGKMGMDPGFQTRSGRKSEHTSNHNNCLRQLIWTVPASFRGFEVDGKKILMIRQIEEDGRARSGIELRAQNVAKGKMSVVYNMMQWPVFGCRYRSRCRFKCSW